ncbi:serine/threonine protein kinase [Halioglobus maricola]|uniref:Serine/threonine protein kinase n=1 Tax=Halioglobus maricola TaxID=2601894 RepID=A0A5P9NKL8_9GAMM|nr:serine/threonine-protein kinase [Halioglobus maricola]QFU76413.1 serine/threonine protein kinase [Halioglobus maricola]
MADFELPGYEIYERLGRGGMASVYRALHLNLDREVAIKVMDPSMNADESFSERFIREARISARLTHPHILQIYDVNTFEGLNYIAMELLPGGELADFIHGEIQQQRIYEIVQQMTDALDYAAGRGYVHRDIKPSNIMLRSEHDFVLADFGIARAANSGTQMTQTGLMVGTPSYMSPEQAKGHEVDGRSDLYALAVLIYEMLTKTLPYESESAVTTAVKHLTEDIPTLPENLAAYQDFINKGLAKAADDRFQTGRELYDFMMEASSGFAPDDVLTEAAEPRKPSPSSAPADENDKTSLAGFEATRLSQSSGPAVSAPGSQSRPYRLENSLQRERMVSGTYAEGGSTKKSGGGALKWLVAVLVTVGLGAGGYFWLQEQQGGSVKDRRNATAELATAYSAMNANDLQGAASAFFKVLSQDRNNAAASAGMAQVEELYTEQLEAALSAGDIDLSKKLLDSFTGYFANNLNLERYTAEVALLEEEQNLAAEQAAFATAQAETAAIEERWAPFTEEQKQTFLTSIVAAKAALESGELELAASSLAEAASIDEEAPELTPLLGQLEVAQDEVAAETAALAAAQQQQVDELLQQAEAAAAEGDFEAARAAVSSSLALLPESASAQEMRDSLGSLESSWNEKIAAEERAAKAEQDRAQRQREEQERQQQAIAGAEATAAKGMRALESGTLDVAQAAYDEVSVQFGEVAAVQGLGQALLQGYASAAREQIDLKEFDAAEVLVGQGETSFPDDALWMELQAEIETGRSSSRRRLGAY